MGRTNVYKDRDLVIAQISPAAGVIIPYGFLTNIDSSERSQLGVTDVADGGFAIIGANIPKPTRMIKNESGYSVSSFVSTASIKTAQAAKWRIQKPGKRYYYSAGSANFAAGAGSESCVCFVPVIVPGGPTFKYAWRMPRYQVLKISNNLRTEAGIQVPANDTDAKGLVFGVNNVRPARASFTGTATDSTYTVTSFCDDTKTLTNWSKISGIQIKTGKPEF